MELWSISLNKFELRLVTLREVGYRPDPYSMLNSETNLLSRSEKTNKVVSIVQSSKDEW